jgi:TfoX/Sxy family transcriptional regulator of competence genes
MPYDDALAERIRERLGSEAKVTEQRMFGGLAFLVRGHMAVAASGQGGLLVRVDPADADSLLSRAGAHPMEMRGRVMRGWLRVDADAVRTKRQLTPWIDRAVAFAHTLPVKKR